MNTRHVGTHSFTECIFLHFCIFHKQPAGRTCYGRTRAFRETFVLAYTLDVTYEWREYPHVTVARLSRTRADIIRILCASRAQLATHERDRRAARSVAGPRTGNSAFTDMTAVYSRSTRIDTRARVCVSFFLSIVCLRRIVKKTKKKHMKKKLIPPIRDRLARIRFYFIRLAVARLSFFFFFCTRLPRSGILSYAISSCPPRKTAVSTLNAPNELYPTD